MKFSVIVPVYNTEKYLRRCIDSILAYNGDDIEVIAVDDGSTDGSLALLHGYDDPRLKVFHKENEGVFQTWKKGVTLASGEYIVFVDSDDSIDGQMFPTLNDILSCRDYDMVQLCWIEKYVKHERRFEGVPGLKEGSYEGEALETVIRENVKMLADKNISTTRWAKAYRAEFLKGILPDTMAQICMLEDDSITRPCLSLMKSFYYSEKALYIHDCCVSGSICNSVEKYGSYFNDCKNLLSYFREKKDLFGFSQETLDRYAAYYYSSIMGEAVRKKAKKVAKEMLADENVVAALKKNGGLKCWLLRHRLFWVFRFMKWSRDLLLRRY